MKLYDQKKYYERLEQVINEAKPGDNISLATLAFQPGGQLNKILDALNAAARRGVRVILLVDAFSFLIRNGASPGPLFYRKNLGRLKGIFQRRMTELERLKESGGEYRIINKPVAPLRNPFSGRSHIKYSVVGDIVFVGGCNLIAEDNTDMMVEFTHKSISKFLHESSYQLVEVGDVRRVLGGSDLRLSITKDTELLIDVGVKGQSLIYDEALKLIDTARREVIMTCQYFPNDRTAQHLVQAEKKGAKVRLIYNHHTHHKWPLSMVHRAVEAKEKRLYPGSNIFSDRRDPSEDYIHAKLLVADDEVIIGSHNYVYAGVKMGTAEIAILSRSKKLIGESKSMFS